ncbi:MAG: hypothetical protein ACKOWG_05655 [Planctomycetia bacterium]
MSIKPILLSAWFVTLSAIAAHGESPAAVAAKPAPVRMGCGIMTFDTVPGWGLDAQGLSQIGPTHGGVAVDPPGHN